MRPEQHYQSPDKNYKCIRHAPFLSPLPENEGQRIERDDKPTPFCAWQRGEEYQIYGDKAKYGLCCQERVIHDAGFVYCTQYGEQKNQ